MYNISKIKQQHTLQLPETQQEGWMLVMVIASIQV